MDGGYGLDSALRRAARDLGLRPQETPPTRLALQAAVREYRELFYPEQIGLLARRRVLALEAMERLAEFRPRLAGALVDGDGPLDRVRLLVEADHPERVILHLRDRHIPWHEDEVVLQFSRGRRQSRPALKFVAGDATIELIVLDSSHRSDPPRDPIGGGPLATLSTGELRALIDAA